ncbi:hypothetical protein B296_00046838, partial [Ensete ventricosum]
RLVGCVELIRTSKEGRASSREEDEDGGVEEEEEEGAVRAYMVKEGGEEGVLGKYELGRALGEGNFGKVKYARHVVTGQAFAVKILDRKRIQSLKIDDQIKREIGTLKLLKHPNVVRLHEVCLSLLLLLLLLLLESSRSSPPRFSSGRTHTWHQLSAQRAFRNGTPPVGPTRQRPALGSWRAPCDPGAINSSHWGGWGPRDMWRRKGVRLMRLGAMPENVLVDAKGNIKISDFGLSALPRHLGNDGLLHTTCGSPNYIAPEVISTPLPPPISAGFVFQVMPGLTRSCGKCHQILSNRGYDGARSDIWSCGVILYVILTGYLPFDDRNLAVLYQKIVRGDTKIPRWLSPGAQNILRRILDPNPITRMNVAGIKADDWFKQDYAPVFPKDDDDDDDSSGDSLPVKERNVSDEKGASPTHINAFQLIGMASSLDLSGFFETEYVFFFFWWLLQDVSERKIRFTSDHSPKELFEKIVDIVTEMGLQVQKGNGKVGTSTSPAVASGEGTLESLPNCSFCHGLAAESYAEAGSEEHEEHCVTVSGYRG